MYRISHGLILIIPILFLCIDSFSQSAPKDLDQPRSKITLYPINVPYALFGRLESSAEFFLSHSNRILVGYHHYRNDWWYGGPTTGNGFELQYRKGLNPDPYVIHKFNPYFGTYYEMDWSIFRDPYSSANRRMVRFGLLSGISKDISSSIKLDLFYGLGVNLYRFEEIDRQWKYGYTQVLMNFKGGLQIGIKL